jgi:hypothetical protein
MTFTKKDEAFVDLALDTLTTIANLVGGATGDTAGSVLTVLRVIISSLEKAHDGTVTPDQVRAQMQQLTDAIKSNDSAADEALRKKFPKSDPDPSDGGPAA